MTMRRMRQTLWLTTAALIGAAGIVLAWGLGSPVTVAAVEGPAAANAADADPAELTPSGIDARRLQRVAMLRLQRPLYDPPPVVKALPPPPPPPKLPVRLIGVAIEPPPGRSVGLFAVGNSIEFKGVGDTLETPGGTGPATVRAIQTTTATVDFAGRTITLELESSESKR